MPEAALNLDPGVQNPWKIHSKETQSYLNFISQSQSFSWFPAIVLKILATEDWGFIFSHFLASGNYLKKLYDGISITGNKTALVWLGSCASPIPWYLPPGWVITILHCLLFRGWVIPSPVNKVKSTFLTNPIISWKILSECKSTSSADRSPTATHSLNSNYLHAAGWHNLDYWELPGQSSDSASYEFLFLRSKRFDGHLIKR